MFWNWFRRRRRAIGRRIDVVCYPLNESLIDVSGFHIEDCDGCGFQVAVSPTTAYAVGNANQCRLMCVHCAAILSPSTLLSQDYINEAYYFVRFRKDLIRQVGEVKTLGDLSRLLRCVFHPEIQL